MREIWKVGVVGGGAMGGGIARLLMLSHMPVVIKERSEDLAQAVHQTLCERIDELVQRDIISWEEAELQKSLLSTTAQYDDLKGVDLVIEAVWENLEDKRKVFEALDMLLPPDVVFASNTSSLSISDLAAFTSRPDKVIGAHFFNPPHRLPLVEIIRGKETSQDTFDGIFDLMEDVLGKTAIHVKECKGFFVNRALLPYLNEAALALEEAKVDPHAIDDEALDFGWPMGPFVLMDMVVGLDIARDVANVLYEAYGERMKPAQLLLYLAKQKRLGQKSGAGVYIHDSERKDEYEPIEAILARLFPDRRADVTASEIFERMMLAMINESARCLEEGVVSQDDIETACVAGIAFPPERGGILHYADELGLDVVVEKLEKLEARYGMRFFPAQILRDKAKDGSTFFEDW